MTQLKRINGHIIYNCFLSGYLRLLKNKSYLNKINLFPVPDGDTGSNMAQTMSHALQIDRIDISIGRTLEKISEKVLTGARGNSGIILSSFINSLSEYCMEKDSLNTADFSSALKEASRNTYKTINKPVEGTIITVIRVWADEMLFLSSRILDFAQLLVKSIPAAERALEKTVEQLPVLKKKGYVDAGAFGFVSFLKGISDMVHSGIVPDKNIFLKDNSDPFIFNTLVKDPDLKKENINFRFCSEALLTDYNHETVSIKKHLNGMGDSLIVTGVSEKLKIHIHTNDPVKIFSTIKNYGRIIESKVDDMLLEYNSINNPVSETAVLTDSIADIPREYIDQYQIHTLNIEIDWKGGIFIDRMTVDSEELYYDLEKGEKIPKTSLPSPAKVKQMFLKLLSYYKSLVVITVSSELSGTWQVMENCAQELREKNYKVCVINSRLNSAAQGLVSAAAAEDAANHLSFESIIRNTEERIKKARIYVSVPTLKYMVRGGRVSPMKGAAAAVLNLKPVVSLDENGKSIKFAASFSRKNSIRKIADIISKNKNNLERYCVVHSGIKEEADIFASKLYKETGIKADYIMEISSTVGIHTGRGALAAGIILKNI